MNNSFIEQNRAAFIQWYNKYINRKGKEELLAYIESTDFFIAPASRKNHMAIPGGLCFHSLNVAKVLTQIMTTPGTVWYNYAVSKNITIESCMLVGLLHDLCKVKFYTVETKAQKTYDPNIVAQAKANKEYVKHDEKGDYVWKDMPYYNIQDQEPYGHGENSLIRILENGGLELTQDEKLAIRWHMGFTVPKDMWGTLNDAMDISPFILAVNFADITATHLLEVEENARLVNMGGQMHQQKVMQPNTNPALQTAQPVQNNQLPPLATTPPQQMQQTQQVPNYQTQPQNPTQTSQSNTSEVNSFDQLLKGNGNLPFNLGNNPFV